MNKVARSEEDVANKEVRFEMDPANPPPLTEAQRAELKALFALPASEIDYSLNQALRVRGEWNGII